MDSLFSELGVFNYINIQLIMLLIAIGFLIKHLVEKFPNKNIPYVLYGLSIVYEIANTIVNGNISKASLFASIIDGTIAAAIAIGLHNGGKPIFKKIVNSYLGSSSSSDDD